MPDWATRTDRSTAARIVGSFVEDLRPVGERQRRVDPVLGARGERRDLVHVAGGEPGHVQDRPPLCVEWLGRGAAHEVLGRDDDRPAGREAPAGLAPGEREPVADPPRIRRVGPPHAGDRDVPGPRLVEAGDEVERVARPDPERRGRALRQRPLDRVRAGRGPRTVDEGRVVLDPLVGGEHREVGHLARGRGGIGVGRRIGAPWRRRRRSARPFAGAPGRPPRPRRRAGRGGSACGRPRPGRRAARPRARGAVPPA